MTTTGRSRPARRGAPLSLTSFAAALVVAFVVAPPARSWLGGGAVAALAAVPEPSAKKPRWEFKFEVVHDLRLIQIQGEWYWFMTYLVTNRTGEDQLFVPNAILYTDAGDIIQDGDVPVEVTQELLELIGNHLLESKNQIIGTLQPGKENAREGLIVWPAGQLTDVGDVRVFVSGLSSDNQVVKNPVTGEDLTVRKHLERQYDTNGELTADPQRAVAFREQRWIMR